MQSDEMTRVVTELVAREGDVPVENITPTANLMDLGIDSLDVLKIAIAFEQRFDVTITTAELLRIRTVNDIVAEIERKVTTP